MLSASDRHSTMCIQCLCPFISTKHEIYVPENYPWAFHHLGYNLLYNVFISNDEVQAVLTISGITSALYFYCPQKWWIVFFQLFISDFDVSTGEIENKVQQWNSYVHFIQKLRKCCFRMCKFIHSVQRNEQISWKPFRVNIILPFLLYFIIYFIYLFYYIILRTVTTYILTLALLYPADRT